VEPIDPLCLTTPRLTLIPFSADLLHLVLTDRAALERRLAARFLPQWHSEDEVDYLTRICQTVATDPASRVWRIHFILHNRDRVVIGDAGFKGPPDRDGSVELAFGFVPAYRRQGYGFEAAHALFRWAFTQPEVRLITSVCDHDNAGAIRVNEKLGMRRVGVEPPSLLWRLSSSIRMLEKAGMRRVSASLLGQLSRGIRVLDTLGVRGIGVKGPSLVWHLSRSRYSEYGIVDGASLPLSSE
jgi:ribosomal-protein-alanine N-acetyltransferase